MPHVSPADISVSAVVMRKRRAVPPSISREDPAHASVLSELIEADKASMPANLKAAFAPT
jgi:hypothetical protein